MAKGCKLPAEAGLENWLSTLVMEADGDLTGSKVRHSPCMSLHCLETAMKDEKSGGIGWETIPPC
jgi:hypothetical protein